MGKIFLASILTVRFFFTPLAFAEVPDEAYSFDYNVDLIEMGHLKEEKILNSLELIRQVFSSPEFRQAILNHSYSGKRKFAYNNGLSNLQIYDKILDGAEKLSPISNNRLDMEIQLYTNLESNTVGYTWTGSPRIWMNFKYFKERCSAKVAGTIIHEWLHKLGFGHEEEYTEERQYTVPYAIGKLVADLAEEFEASEKLLGDDSP